MGKFDFYSTMLLSFLGYLSMYRRFTDFYKGNEAGYAYSLWGIILAFLLYILRWRSYSHRSQRFKSTLFVVACVSLYSFVSIVLFHRETQNVVPYISCFSGLILTGYFLRNSRPDERPFLLYYLGAVWFLLASGLPASACLLSWLVAGTGIWSMEVLKKRVRDGDYKEGSGYRQTSTLLCAIVVAIFTIMAPTFWTTKLGTFEAARMQVSLPHPSITALYCIVLYFLAVEYILFTLTQSGRIRFQTEE